MSLKSKLQFVGLLFSVWAITVLSMLAVLRMPQLSAASITPTGGKYWTAGVDGIGATLTKLTLGTDSAVPDVSMDAIYITDLTMQSTTGTAGQMILRHGTSTELGGAANCGSDTKTFFPSASTTTARITYPLFTGLGANFQFKTPIRVPPGRDICALGIATQLLVLDLRGELRP